MPDKQTIVLIDDDKINVTILAEMLKDDYRVCIARNGAEGLTMARTELPDLILLDIMMPDMDGYKVCESLRNDPVTCRIPVIFISAMGEEGDETKGFAVGAVDYIIKPISASIVRARVETHLALQRNIRELKEAYRTINDQKRRMQKELKVGHQIQQSMLPKNFPERQDLQIHARLRPAREVGGDFYDFFFTAPDTICFSVGDVSGKGVPAALFMAVAKTLLKSHAVDGYCPADILRHVNKELNADNDASMFVTLFLAILDLQTGEMIYANAGHNPPLIKRRDGSILRLEDRHGIVLGAFDDSMYEQGIFRLESKDLLLAYTDGVTEAIDADTNEYTEDRLQILMQRPTVSPAQVVEDIIGNVDRFAGDVEQFDDITVLALAYNR